MQLLNGGSGSGAQMPWAGGTGFFALCGTFAGRTVSLEVLGPDGKTLLTLASYAAAATAVFQLPPCTLCAAVVSPAQITAANAKASPALWASIAPVVEPTLAVTNSVGTDVENSAGGVVENTGAA